MVHIDRTLIDFRDAISRIYGENLAHVILFGSRARGDHRDESDYDVAIFIDHFTSVWKELNRIQPVAMSIFDKTGAMISAKPLPTRALSDETSFMDEIRRDGIEI